jgi:UDPglucose 6-dehydrogenase
MLARNWPTRLDFTTDLDKALVGADAAFIAVGTPPNEDGSADLSAVLAVAHSIAEHAPQKLVVVLKSTVPVGTNARVTEVFRAAGRADIVVASNPEFLKEGDAINDFLKPDRIVVGVDDDDAFEVLARLYAPFNRQQNRLLRMSPKSAEIVKYASNAMLATKISFMNEIAMLCEAAGGDVESVRVAVGADRRIGHPFLYPGLGFGGSCFPKDLRALVQTGSEHGLSLDVAKAAISANKKPATNLLTRLTRDLGGLSGKHIALWGLAFKPKTDDVREAAALKLIKQLVERGATVRASDPEAMDTGRIWLSEHGILSSVTLVEDAYEACRGADALVIATEWMQFRAPDFERLKGLLRGRHVFDGRNALVPQAVVDAGLAYRGMGRPAQG